MNIDHCHLCDSKDLNTVIDLGYHPLADTFLTQTDLSEPETRYPLRVALCDGCGALQSEYVVSAADRYQKHAYSYDSSNSPVAVRHFEELAVKMREIASLSSGDIAVDIGSNVGTLLQNLKEVDIRTVGIEPSALGKIGNERGIETIVDFFGKDAVDEILKRHGEAKTVVMTNVFNHIEDVNGFFDALDSLLRKDGTLFIEVPYVPELVEKTAFDTIYLEHVSYFAVTPFLAYAKKRGWFFYHLETNAYMGGSILVALGRDPSRENVPLVEEYLKKEQDLGLRSLETYEAFMERTRNLKSELNATLSSLKKDGKRVAGLGAATKGNTLLNYCGIDADTLECVLESSPFKIGKYTPGSHIPILDEREMDPGISHLLILPWNLGDYLKEKLGHLPVEFIIPHV